MFKFLHAADIHLDSPLRGLQRYEGAPVDEIRTASRRALSNLVQLAIDEQVAFVLIAGDIYDGGWKDYNTGLYFLSQIQKLRAAEIPVYMIAGNHDAMNKMDKTLRLPDGVFLLQSGRPETLHLKNEGVAIHGQSFAKAAETDDLSQTYPAAESGLFNIGLLHTCATGREGHDRYAPCTLDGLRAKEYDYWALGHIHQRENLASEDEPPIVFPGNIQGRHIRECGAKGCMLVTVDDTHHVRSEFRALDVLRWEQCRVDASDAEDVDELLTRFSDALTDLTGEADGRPLAVRVEFAGSCGAHEAIAKDSERWVNEVRALTGRDGLDQVWVEKVSFRTTTPSNSEAGSTNDGPIGELLQLIEEIRADETQRQELVKDLSALTQKLPGELTKGGDALDFGDEAWLSAALRQVEQLLQGRLLANREER